MSLWYFSRSHKSEAFDWTQVRHGPHRCSLSHNLDRGSMISSKFLFRLCMPRRMKWALTPLKGVSCSRIACATCTKSMAGSFGRSSPSSAGEPSASLEGWRGFGRLLRLVEHQRRKLGRRMEAGTMLWRMCSWIRTHTQRGIISTRYMSPWTMWMWVTTNGVPTSTRPTARALRALLVVSSAASNIIDTSWALSATSGASLQKNALTELIRIPRYSIQSWCKSYWLRWRNGQSQVLRNSQRVQTTQGGQEARLCLLRVCLPVTTKPSSNVGWCMKMLASHSTRHPTSSRFPREFTMLVSVCPVGCSMNDEWCLLSSSPYIDVAGKMGAPWYQCGEHHIGERWRRRVDRKGQWSGICAGVW